MDFRIRPVPQPAATETRVVYNEEQSADGRQINSSTKL